MKEPLTIQEFWKLLIYGNRPAWQVTKIKYMSILLISSQLIFNNIILCETQAINVIFNLNKKAFSELI
jgi:hypothetical protein